MQSREKMMEALNEYLRLRDAKSNGQSPSENLLQVLAYDKKIEEAYDKYQKARSEYLFSIHAQED